MKSVDVLISLVLQLKKQRAASLVHFRDNSWYILINGTIHESHGVGTRIFFHAITLKYVDLLLSF